MASPAPAQAASSPAFFFDEASHRYTRADGLYVPSVTQVLKRVGYVDYSQVAADVLESASIRGTAVHQITEFLDTEFAGVPEAEIDLAPINPEYLPYVQAWLRFKRECDVQILDSELQGIAEINGMPVGFKYDTRALVNGREAIIEKKTCAEEYGYWGLQLAGYDLALPQCKTQLHRERYAVQLRNNGTYRMCPGTAGGYSDANDYHAFTWALAIYWDQLNRKYKFEE
jgi:hypothetical protein